ncbi:segregation/condensation protein A [Candidatus Woesearchaeota archaeon]|nr:segregation/condensation protein A [Candidatus Woesearchaeota archaeon]
MHDQILDMLLKKDEITWQTILYELIKTEKINPWDIDVSLLSQKYLQTIRKLQETNFFISGKVILASAILLKIKSEKLVSEDIAGFDRLMFSNDELEEVEDFSNNDRIAELRRLTGSPRLTIRTPLARKKRVTLQDLVVALEKALEIDKRRTLRRIELGRIPEDLHIPEKKIDISKIIKDVYDKIIGFFEIKKNKEVTFTELVSSNKREDKILTFVPLLHLANQSKISIDQNEHFGEITVTMYREPKIE